MNRNSLFACILVAIVAGAIGWFVGQGDKPAIGAGPGAPAAPAATAEVSYPEGVGRGVGNSLQTFPLNAAAADKFAAKIESAGFVAVPEQQFNVLLPADYQNPEFANLPAFRYKSNSPGAKFFLGYSPGANNFHLATAHTGSLAQSQAFKAETARLLSILTK